MVFVLTLACAILLIKHNANAKLCILSGVTIADGVAFVAVRACLHREHDDLVFVLRIFVRGHLATLRGLAFQM